MVQSMFPHVCLFIHWTLGLGIWLIHWIFSCWLWHPLSQRPKLIRQGSLWSRRTPYYILLETPHIESILIHSDKVRICDCDNLEFDICWGGFWGFIINIGHCSFELGWQWQPWVSHQSGSTQGFNMKIESKIPRSFETMAPSFGRYCPVMHQSWCHIFIAVVVFFFFSYILNIARQQACYFLTHMF